MKLRLTVRARDNYLSLPRNLRKLADKQFSLLIRNLRYPSLHAKKYDESSGEWQARVNGNYRFYFYIVNDTYLVASITKHPK